MKTKLFYNFTACILIFTLILSISLLNTSAEDQTDIKKSYSKPGSYDEYKDNLNILSPIYPLDKIDINASEYAQSSQLSKESIKNKNCAVMNKTNQCLKLNCNVNKTGFYYIKIEYCALPDNDLDIELDLKIDEKSLFDGMKKITLSRMFESANKEFEKDNRGNEIRPVQEEIQDWQSNVIEDDEGAVGSPYRFWLTEGAHSLSLTLKREKVAISTVEIFNEETLPKYNAPDDLTKLDTDTIFIEAEHPDCISSSVLYPVSNMNNPNTTPSDASLIRLNAIGGSKWVYPSQKIKWNFSVQKSGYYSIGMRYLQNFKSGLNTYRSMKIDDKYPFAELTSLPFKYSAKWQNITLGGDNPYYLWFDEGNHSIEMSVTTGEICELTNNVENSVYQLNQIYRKIIKITGTNPDIYRDYYLDQMIPDLIDNLKLVSSNLKDSESDFLKETGVKGGEASILKQVYYQLDTFYKSPNSIPSRLSTFETNISSLATWVMDIREQPLELDKLYIVPYGNETPKDQYGVFGKLCFSMKSFIMSFLTDYSSVGDVYDKGITVWINSGRDQAEIAKRMIDDEFTVKTSIHVNFSIVQNSLMQAVMAGKGPDVALFVNRGEPVNMALRDAILPLNQFEDFDKVAGTYNQSDLLPFNLKGNCYGLPESKSFYMMFYRTDIFKELSLSPPKTWDELYKVAEVLQRNNMNVGLPYSSMSAYQSVSMGIGSTSIFPTLLLQNGIKFYNSDLSATSLSSEKAFEVFNTWTQFYTLYGFPLIKNDYNRFRSGEMPLIIANYSLYSQLNAAAPEIKNYWEMTTIPGVLTNDGSINNSQVGSGTACIMIRDTVSKNNSWEFMKWWTDENIQGEYARNVEMHLGIAARYQPVKKNALMSIPWAGDELETILNGFDSVNNIEEIPGGYYSSRNLDNALRAVVYNKKNPRETLNYWNKKTNEEIVRKRKEFNVS